MELSIYQHMNEIEQDHWWFKAKQEIILSLLQQWGRLESGMRILDLGCGTGNILHSLSQFDVEAEGRDMSEEALRICHKRGLHAESGCLPYSIDVKEKADTIIMLDVLEHIPNDEDALLKLHDFIQPNGRVVLTVPAHPFLWSTHDESHHHIRRYSKNVLLDLIKASHWEVEFFSPYNSFLFPLAVINRIIKRITGRNWDENQIPNPLINSVLYFLFHAETGFLQQKLSFTFGLSYLVYLKPQHVYRRNHK